MSPPHGPENCEVGHWDLRKVNHTSEIQGLRSRVDAEITKATSPPTATCWWWRRVQGLWELLVEVILQLLHFGMFRSSFLESTDQRCWKQWHPIGPSQQIQRRCLGLLSWFHASTGPWRGCGGLVPCVVHFGPDVAHVRLKLVEDEAKVVYRTGAFRQISGSHSSTKFAEPAKGWHTHTHQKNTCNHHPRFPSIDWRDTRMKTAVPVRQAIHQENNVVGLHVHAPKQGLDNRFVARSSFPHGKMNPCRRKPRNCISWSSIVVYIKLETYWYD